MFREAGGLFGWLLIFAFIGTIMNYIIKFINKKWGKMISSNPTGKKLMKMGMKIFVQKHKYFGMLTVVLLLAHFLIQFFGFGLNVTGGIAAAILLLQVLFGMYGHFKKRPRKGLWFTGHRIIATLLIVGIGVHLAIPNVLNAMVSNNSSNNIAETVDTSSLPTFTLDELAQYDGKNGNKAYVAYEGIVYDVTSNSNWNNGTHNGMSAGTDLTDFIGQSPHGDSVFANLDVVGTLE